MEKSELQDVKRVYCIGIGGIGVSALARMFLDRGAQVSGSDVARSRITESLEKQGATIFYEQKAENVPEDVDLVVRTIAIPDDHPELIRARQSSAAVMTYPEVLGLISRAHRTIAVAGTHGKTTTTAMIAEILIGAGLSPTVIVGSLLRGYESNYVRGESDLFVVEACEYRESFAHIEPHVLVITNIEAEHLDYYKDLEHVENAFQKVVERVPENGTIVANLNDESVRRVVQGARAQVVDFVSGKNSLELSVPGEHNRENAAAALSVARAFGVEEEKTRTLLRTFEGTWRRFEHKGDIQGGVKVYDDYAHHPTEIRATLAAAREKFSNTRIIAVFQPHLYSRTRSLFSEFAQAFDDADDVIVLPIYKAREAVDSSISSSQLVEEIKKNHPSARFEPTHEKAISALKAETSTQTGNGAVIVTIGAGDVYKVADALVEGNSAAS